MYRCGQGPLRGPCPSALGFGLMNGRALPCVAEALHIDAAESIFAQGWQLILDWALIFMLMVFIFMLSTAVSPSICMSPSCCRHVSFLC